MLFSAHGLRLQYRDSSAAQRRLLGGLRHFPWLPRDAQVRSQLESLNSLLGYAREQVPFYRDRLPDRQLRHLDELRLIPTFTRRDALGAGSQLHSRAYPGHRVIELSTGGTTGDRLKVLASPRALGRHYAAFRRFREWIGLANDVRLAVFIGSHLFPPAQRDVGTWMFEPTMLMCSADMVSSATLPTTVEALVAFGPQVIDAYPSSIEAVARYMRWQGDTRLRPAAIITSAEPLTPSARRIIEETFACPVFDHYAHAELAALITQCRAGSYHINADYGIVELIRDGRPAQPGEAGEIVATGFINLAMPFIRYATGDWAVATETGCACGRTFPTVGPIVGRQVDFITARDGTPLLRLDPAFKRAPAFLETRIIQDAPDHLIVEAVASGAIDPLEATTLLHELQLQVGPTLRTEFRSVGRIPRTPSGKMRAVVHTDSPGATM